MTCATARTQMLTADPAELAGSTGSDLSLHIATCTSCRALGASLLEAQAELARAIDATGEADGADGRDAVRSAIAVARRRRDDARRRRWMYPLSAAAVLAGWMVMRYRDRTPVLPSLPVAPPAAGRGITVAPPQGRNVAVLQTDNPNVVIIWFF